MTILTLRPGQRVAVHVGRANGSQGSLRVTRDVLELKPLDAVRVGPGVARALEAGPDGLEVLIFGPHVEGDSEMVDDFWARDSAGYADSRRSARPNGP